VAALFAVGGAAFFLLCGYEFVRGTSASLFIGAFGARRLPWVMALSPVGTLLVVYVYGWLLSRLSARRTLLATTLLSGGVMAACYVGAHSGLAAAAAALYVFREAYIVVIIEQYWSYVDSTLTTDQARRYNGPMCGLASVGAILGSSSLGYFAESLGTVHFILLAAISTVPAGVLGLMAYRLGGDPAPGPPSEREPGHLALPLFRRHRQLRLLLAVVVATQLVATVLDIAFSELVEEALQDTDQRSSYLGYFWASVNTGALVLQFVVTPLLLPRLSLRCLHLAIPLIHVAGAIALLLHPTLTVGAAVFLLFKAVDYSLFRAGKEVLYMPLPFDARYRSKEVIDAFGYRAAKGGGSTLLIPIEGLIAVPAAAYPAAAAIVAAVWVGLASRLTGKPANAS
jgi:AAA family ATP:ADP antiporter